MAEIIKMPRLSDTMKTGVVSKWYKKIGDLIKEGEVISDIETDKATMEFESFQEGVLLYIGVKEGESAEVDSILAIIGDKNENIDELLNEQKNETKESKKEEIKTETKKKEKEIKKELKEDIKKEYKEEPKNSIQKEDNLIFAISPIAKKIASENNVELSLIKGSGDNGRIIKRDIEKIILQKKSTSKNKKYSVGLSQMRKIIAEKLSESKFNAPHFYLSREINMDKVVDLRKTIKNTYDTKIYFNDIIVKACAVAIESHKEINSSWNNDSIIYKEDINIGVAMAIDEGLIVPVIKEANKKTLTDLSLTIKNFAEKIKYKNTHPDDFSGNTFTISNLGMFGIDNFTAIINPPDSCILAVGNIVKKPIVNKENKIIISNIMKITLSCDHRVVDGAVGAKFLKTLTEYLENPVVFLGKQSI